MKRLNRIAGILMLVLLLLGGYVGAYFACSEYFAGSLDENGVGYPTERTFPSESIAKFFEPLVRLEATIRGKQIHGRQKGYPSTQH